MAPKAKPHPHSITPLPRGLDESRWHVNNVVSYYLSPIDPLCLKRIPSFSIRRGHSTVPIIHFDHHVSSRRK